MYEDKQYSIIREQGEFMDPVMLNQQDNATVNSRDANDNKDADNDNNR